ncbi:MAG: hypothetical protein ACRDM1_11170 [Gaiellaceae bacterium]
MVRSSHFRDAGSHRQSRVMLAYAPSTGTAVIVGLSIFGPVVVTALLAWFILRGAKNDPDEQRWRRLAEQRRSESRED